MAILSLDDPAVLETIVNDGMLSCLRLTPELCRQGWQRGVNLNLPPDYCDIDKVVILGMGGSAIGGELAAGLVLPEIRQPIIINRNYELPAFTDARTLVIASSHSGNTEETLAAFGESLKTEAKKLVLTTGGQLAAAAASAVPALIFSSQTPPRAAVPFSLMLTLGILQNLRLIGDKQAAVTETAAVLAALNARIDENIPHATNPAKDLASRLYGNLTVVYGGGITAGVARRWKAQLNENSKAWAFDEAFPELNHNAVTGYRFPDELTARTVVVLLEAACLEQRVRLRYRLTAGILEKAGVRHRTVVGEGMSPLSQLMSLVLFGDYVSCYLAALYRTEPSPVTEIDEIKRQLNSS